MNKLIDQLVGEFKALRKGFGVDSTNLEQQVGPALRASCGVTPQDGADELRAKVRLAIRELIVRLPERERPIVLAAFAFTGGALRYQGRIKDEADRLGVDSRTIQRRVDDAVLNLARLAAGRGGDPAPEKKAPWRIDRLQAFLNLDLKVPEVVEIRQIEAVENGLAELEFDLTLTPPDGWEGGDSLEDLGVDLFHGGELTGRTMKSTNRVSFRLRLPHSLGQGEKHEYAIRVKLPAERGIAPLYMCTPHRTCAFFDLHVRFPANDVPREIWRAEGVSPLELDDPRSDRVPIRADEFGDVRQTFTALDPFLSYGVGWNPNASP